MRKTTRSSHFPLALIICALLAANSPSSIAESDKELAEKALMARELQQQDHEGHAAHEPAAPIISGFRGVFYGYLPCEEKDCNGIKMTLSLNPKNNYLLIIQFAKGYSRETFEKGQYEWNDADRSLVLKPRNDSPARRFRIMDEGTVVQLNPDGTMPTRNQDDYALKRSDLAKNREMHIH